MIASDSPGGCPETVILAQLMRGDSYGYRINKMIQQKSGGELELKEATLYTVFRRLEQSGDITAYWGDETTGARRKYYAITDKGRETYCKLSGEWKHARDIINNLMETEVQP